MNNMAKHSSRPRLPLYLAISYTLFIVYASLTPFSGWQEQGLFFVDVLTAPPGQTFTWFDAILNCISYVPFGFFWAYMLRNHWGVGRILIGTTLLGLFASLMMEYIQIYLPARVSSNIDLLSNTAGTFCGAVIALSIAKISWYLRIKTWHEQWIKHDGTADFGLAILAVWMLAQVNPSLPMLGSVFVSAVARWRFDIVQATPFNWLELCEVALNMLLLGILLMTLMRDRRNTLSALVLVLAFVTLIKFIAASIFLKSWALFLWLNSEAILGIIAGLLLLLAVMKLSKKWLLGVGGLIALCYLLLVLNLLLFSSSSVVMRLYHWQYIHMLNYNSLSQLINLLFPILLMGYLWRTGISRK